MKLGTETGSITNHMYSIATKNQPEPFVGMGATILAWTDRYAGTIVEVFTTGKTLYVTVQRDDTKRIDNEPHFTEHQEYEYTPNPRREKETFRFSIGADKWKHVTKNLDTGRWRNDGEYGLRIGERKEYRDPSF